MPAEFTWLYTALGLAKRAAAEAGGALVAPTTFLVGDGNGVAHTAAEILAHGGLYNQVWTGAINRVYQHPIQNNLVVVEALIPTTAGGWTIREAGIKDAAGDLILVGQYPATEKPAPGSGGEKEIMVRGGMRISNGGDTVLQIDSSLVMATQAYVDTHAVRTDNPHGVTAAQAGAATEHHRHDGTLAPIEYAVDSGVANAYVITLDPALTAHVEGMPISFKAVNANSAASTIAINGLPAVAIKQADGSALPDGAIVAGQIVTIIYTGAAYMLVSGRAIATDAEVQGGTNKTKVVTPKGLAAALGALAVLAGFSYSFGITGYIKFPSWFLGFMIQWGLSGVIPANTTAGTALFMAFPTAVYSGVATHVNSGLTNLGNPFVSNFTTTEFQVTNNGIGSAQYSYIVLGK